MADETPAPVKPGYKTTEFWLMLVVTIAGLLPAAGLFPSDSQILKVCGLIVSAATALGWTYKRTDLKKSVVLLMCLGMLALGGCHTGEIQAVAVDGLVRDITNRHDQFIRGELKAENLSAADKATYLRSTEILRGTVKEALK